MGMTVYYRSTEPVDPKRAAAIREAADPLCEGRTWLSCEPVYFFSGHDAGHLHGGSKPNFQPDPEEAAEAAQSPLPDGTVRDMLDVLCELSRIHGVDWELSHDYDPAPAGYIRNGVADDSLTGIIDAFASLPGFLEEAMMEMEGLVDERAGGSARKKPPDDDDAAPRILRFPTKDG